MGGIMLQKKIAILIVSLSAICATLLWATTGNVTVDKIRPEGSKRTYQFLLKDQKFGRLESTAKGKSSLDDIEGFRFDEALSLDLTPLGNQYELKIKNKHYIDERGHYIGDEMKIEVNNQEQSLYLKHAGDILSGYFKKDTSKQTVNFSLDKNIFSADNNMIDQYEIFLAMRDFKVGDTIIDSIFVPQAMIKAPVQIVIEAFTGVRYGSSVDSAFVCHFIEPSDQIAYMTRAKKIVRLAQPSQSITVELVENPLDKFKAPAKYVSIGDILRRTPLYAVYMIFGLVLCSPFIIRNYRKPIIYIAVILGAFSYYLLKITHVPLQEWYASSYILPGIQAGGSLYYYAIFSAIFTGLIQEAVKFVPIFLLFYLARGMTKTPMIIGIFCAMGFGVYEAGALTGAGYQAGGINMISWPVFERFFAIFFNITAGALVGFSLNRGLKYILSALLSAILIHSLSSYLIVLVQKRTIDFAIFEIIVALIYLLFLLAVYLFIRNFSARKAS